MAEETTNQDILEAVNAFATTTEKRLGVIEADLSQVKSDLSQVKSDLNHVKSDLSQVKSDMVTKDFLEVKLGELKGDIVVIVRQEDAKLATLIQELTKLNVLPTETAKRILAMRPFPEIHM